MGNKWRAWAVALAMIVVAPAAAAKEEDGGQFAAQVRNYLGSQATKHVDEGFSADAVNPDFVVSLTLQDAVVWPVTLRRGVVYRVFAACDNNCSDIDLDLYDASGAFVGRDVLANDKPFVEITPRADGVHYARIWLAACEVEPCYVGARVYRRN